MRVKRAVSVGLALGGLVLLPAATAHSATDKTPPVLKTPATADFLVGSSLSAEGEYGCGDVGQFADVGETFTFTGSDNSGYVRFNVQQQLSDEPPDVIERNSTVTTVTGYNTNYHNDCGGDGTLGSWWVQAKDKAGNLSPVGIVGGSFDLYQDDNAALAYSGAWAISHCNCWSGLTTHDTSTKNASASITIPAGAHHVGIAMAVGPPQGSAQIMVDGVVKATINTFASTKSPRVIVWDGPVAAGSSHTVTIVNLATAGHPRVDIDAVLVD